MTTRDTRTSDYRTREYRRSREKSKVQVKGHEPGRGTIWFVYGLPVPSTEPVTGTRHLTCEPISKDRWGPVYECIPKGEEPCPE